MSRNRASKALGSSLFDQSSYTSGADACKIIFKSESVVTEPPMSQVTMGFVSGVAEQGAAAERNDGKDGNVACCADTNAEVVLGAGTIGIACPLPEEPANMYIVGPAWFWPGAKE